jgi:hypothetical protein
VIFLKNKLFLVAILILLLYVFPLIVLGQDSYVLIHDNLDSNIIWFKILAESGMAFSLNTEVISPFMGAPRISFGNEYDLLFWFHDVFGPYPAYVINQILIRIIAFMGMFLFLNRYILKETEHTNFVILISLLYSLLPFWPTAGISIAGLPLITYVFLNIKYSEDTISDWLILISFPFYSSFIFSMMFYIIFLSIIWISELILQKVTWKFTFSIFIFAMLYLLINYRLLEVFIFGTDFISHRVERVSEYYTFGDCFNQAVKHFVFGQYHAESLHLVFLPFILIVFIINLVSKKRDKLFIILFAINIFISMWYGFWKYEAWESIKASSRILSSLNLSRFHCLTPFIWFTLLALSLKYYLTQFSYKYKNQFSYFILFGTIIFLFYKSDFIQEYKNHGITYKQFYSKSLFKKIDTFIGKDKSTYKIISLGMHPSISQYNGFHTLDGYNANYPLEYKHKFREIIEKELDKNKKLKKSFDNWGSRCYLFASDVGYYFIRTKDSVYPIKIDINTDIIHKLGGRYIFSSYPIVNFKENNIQFLKLFEDESSAWKIYLYEVNGQYETKSII